MATLIGCKSKSPGLGTASLVLLCILGCAANARAQRTILLHSDWKAKRCGDIVADGNAITGSSFRFDGWMNAVVPGTILTTLLHNHLVPDPFFAMNNNLIPDVFDTGKDYYTYWFYNAFALPVITRDQQVWLNFRGINYFADIFLNGKRVNSVTHQGMFLREKYLITPFLVKDGMNRLAVQVAPPDPVGNAMMGQGGDGMIGRNITMQCTAGWDWICPIRDRNTGIWDQVSVEITGPVDIRNPYVESRVPGLRTPGQKQAPAFVKVSVELKNATGKPIGGKISVVLNGKEILQDATLKPYEEKILSFPEIEITNPRLWWPNGMGEQPMYTLEVGFRTMDGILSDAEQVPFGIRETGNYFDDNIKARVFQINGQKIFIKGGNWIASDALLRLTKERYDAEIRMHAGMNMNMIRVWGGGITERPEFYEACDRYGILVWQDIWISGDCNGEWNDPTKKESQARRKEYPDDHDLFLASVGDQVKMLRNHPSLYLWCGGNETYPPPDINAALENDIFPHLDPRRYYLDKSTSPKLMTNSKGGTGDGPYGLQEPDKIFTEQSFPFNPEVGSIGIPNLEGLTKIIPADELQPPESFMGSGSWRYHKYLPLADFLQRYGDVKDIGDFCMKAQLVGYEQFRALQEGFNYKMWEWYTGMLVWKNQNPWTALRGFFYDYYLDYTGSYFGYQHGAVPLHIQLNLNDSVVCVLNQTALACKGITAVVQVLDIHGRLLSEDLESVSLEPHRYILLSQPDSLMNRSGVSFLKLMLKDKGEILDENLYWISGKPKNYEHLNDLAETKVTVTLERIAPGKTRVILANPGSETAFFMRLKVLDSARELVLPVFLTDNYVTVFPGESKTLVLDCAASVQFTRGEKNMKLAVEGWNVPYQETGL